MKLYYGEALSLMMRTLPCVLVRWGVNMAFGLALLVYYAIIFGLAFLAGQIHPIGFVVVAILGLAGSGGLYYWLRQYVLYILKAGHIAVMMEILMNDRVPEGSQLQWGREQVQSRFKDVSILFGVDQLVRGVVRGITNMVGGALTWLPIPNIRSLVNFAKQVMRTASDYIDEAILARAYMKREQNVWEVAKEGTVLYAMAWKPILLNAFGLTIISWISFGVFAAIFAVPGFLLYAILPEAIQWAAIVAVFAFAFLSKLVFGDTFALAATLAAYHHETKDLTPDPEWTARLEQVNGKFRQLGERAREQFTPRDVPQHSSIPQ